ncbi:methylenetetrahydrofolate reductase C-terminal domain-containing protein [Pseudophaeobacter sp.]|uniref:methylenetetrahydrofolate reductase C-terminal domain-containing protein n=1 Tax=Pseudophaeobacter sp. TaxID=1971739 RepID=UPI00329698DA
MYRVRLFAIRHSRSFEWIYHRVEQALVALDPVLSRIGYQRVERPVALVEKVVKSVLFDCKMCGQCVLSSTGMSCPMNCPKQLRNGPCGGVRPGAYCEVKPEMKCVWSLAWDGASRMKNGAQIAEVLPPVERNLEGSSSWLRVSREKAAQLREAHEARRTTIAKAFPGARKVEPSTAPLVEEPEAAHLDPTIDRPAGAKGGQG